MKVIHYEQVPEKNVADEEAEGSFIRVLIGPDDGARNFAMRRFRIVPGGHTPRHVHVYKNGKLVVKWDLDHWQPMKGEASARVLRLIRELEDEGAL